MGIRALKFHSVSKIHLKLKDSKCKHNAITSYYGRANSWTSLSATASSIAAEIYWALKCTKENWSENSCKNNNILFTTMFLDSKIAKSLCMNRTKYSYVTNFGISPFFNVLLKTFWRKIKIWKKLRETQGSLGLLKEVSGHSGKIFWLKEWQPWVYYKLKSWWKLISD